MSLIISLLGFVGMIGAGVLTQSLTPLGLLVVALLLVGLYLWAKKYGDDLTPGMELMAPNAVMSTAMGFVVGAIYYHGRDPVFRILHLLVR